MAKAKGAPGERRWAPNSPPQEAFLAYNGFEALYGGAAGGGKSESLLIDALYGIGHPSYRAILFRRTIKDLKKSLIDRAQDFYPHARGAYNRNDHVWTFPSGASIAFDHIQHDGDERRFDSAEFSFVGFDELTHFLRDQYLFLVSRLRSSKGLRPRIRAATNPGGIGHEWVFERWRAWLDPRPEYDGPRARSGEVLYFAPDETGKKLDGVAVPRGTPDALARTFVRALATDNPAIDAQYLSQLKMLDRVTRAQKLGGDWLVKPGKGLYFQRTWWRYLEQRPPRASWRRAVRAWDFAGSKKGDWTVGILYVHVPTCITPWVIVDMIRFRDTPGGVMKAVKAVAEEDGRDVEILIPQDPGQAGKFQADSYVAALPGYDVTTHRPTGEKVTRAKPHSSQVEHGLVALVRGDWNRVLVEEHQDLPEGDHDDIVDATSDGHNFLAGAIKPASYKEARAGWKQVVNPNDPDPDDDRSERRRRRRDDD